MRAPRGFAIQQSAIDGGLLITVTVKRWRLAEYAASELWRRRRDIRPWHIGLVFRLFWRILRGSLPPTPRSLNV